MMPLLRQCTNSRILKHSAHIPVRNIFDIDVLVTTNRTEIIER